MKKITFLFGLLLLSLWGFAQKIGYCQVDQIIAIMPEAEKAKAQYEKEVQDYQNELEQMQVEYNNKLKEYQDNMALPDNDPKKWSKLVIQNKEQELMQLQQRIYEFQNQAQTELQKRQVELMQPVYNKVDSVLGVIAKEKGLSIILKDNTLVYINQDKCVDVTPEVKQKLKLQ